MGQRTGMAILLGVDLNPLTGCIRSIGTARLRSMEVEADCARSALAARNRVDCIVVGRL